MSTLQTILVPIDGSAPSLAALEHALVLAEDYGATLTALRVLAPTDALTPAAPEEVAAEQAMDAAVERVRAAIGEARLVRRVVVGEPVTEIVNAAHDADLVVIGTHGRIGRIHELLGSVAEGVVRNAPCPVLTVHDATGAYQSFAERRHHRPSIGSR